MPKRYDVWKYYPALLLTLATVFTGVSTSPSAEAGTDSRTDARPNFVVIILDDWGWRESGAYGNPDIQTPNIDNLARDGAQFNNAFLTASTCTSSRASILTGLHPFAAGTPRLGTHVPADRKLLSHYLHQAGYFTAVAGKWHLGDDVMNQFDLIVPERDTSDSTGGEEDWGSTIETKLNAKQPFFLWLAAKDPHRPWSTELRWSVHQPAKIHIPAYIELNKIHTPEFVKGELAQYYNEINRADFHIGEVVKTLKRKKLLDNTVIILMSDNGSPFWKAKKFLTDPGLKTPFIVYWPKQITQHKDVNELMSSVDIAPTLLDLAGVAKPAQMEGTSFAPWLTSNSPDKIKPIREYVYGERGDGVLGSENGRSIRDKKYLYLIDDYKTYTECSDPTKLNPLRSEQLYDVVSDPDNLKNLATHYSWAMRLWRKVKGETDYTPTLIHYRELLAERRKQRNDLPEPIIKGVCPPMWWREEPADSTTRSSSSKSNPQTKDE